MVFPSRVPCRIIFHGEHLSPCGVSAHLYQVVVTVCVCVRALLGCMYLFYINASSSFPLKRAMCHCGFVPVCRCVLASWIQCMTRCYTIPLQLQMISGFFEITNYYPFCYSTTVHAPMRALKIKSIFLWYSTVFIWKYSDSISITMQSKLWL